MAKPRATAPSKLTTSQGNAEEANTAGRTFAYSVPYHVNRKKTNANSATLIRYLTIRFNPNFMNRYIRVPIAAISITKMLALRVIPLVVSGKIVIGTIGAFDD